MQSADYDVRERGVVIDNAKFDSASFAGATLKHTFFSNSSIIGADFSRSHIKGNEFANSDVSNSRFNHVTGAIAISNSKSLNVDFTKIDGASVGAVGSDLSGSNFSGSLIKNANFSYSDLSNVILNLKDKNLSKAGFDGANLHNVDLSGYNLSGSWFGTPPEAKVAWKNGLDGTNFSGANLTNSYFDYANLATTIFKGADLRGASVTNSDISKQKNQDIQRLASNSLNKKVNAYLRTPSIDITESQGIPTPALTGASAAVQVLNGMLKMPPKEK